MKISARKQRPHFQARAAERAIQTERDDRGGRATRHEHFDLHAHPQRA